jgi:N-acetylglucosamine-6-phosphate deacetylase
MNDTWLIPKQIFDGFSLKRDMALLISDGIIKTVTSAANAPKYSKKSIFIICSGFIDLQVNGGGGVLINDTPTADAMISVAKTHRQFGTVGILPTVITDTPEVLAFAVDAAIKAKGSQGIFGLHIEGPHISVERRGTHAIQHIRPLDKITIQHVKKLRKEAIPVMITLAPEASTSSQIAELVATGAIVSIGHSDATSEETHAAICAGANCATHLFNAMSPMLNRAPGVTGAVINADIFAGLIVDGIHVSDEMIKLAIRARPKVDRLFIVSDAMPTVGGPDKFSLYNMKIHLHDGRLINDEGNLAGAHFTQSEGVFRLVNNIGIDKAEALRMAITVPSSLMGFKHLANLQGRRVQDLICLNEDLSFNGYLSEN